jgi:hypothetical protein
MDEQYRGQGLVAGIVLLGAWLLLGIGMSWAHIRARLCRQASVDRVDA